MALHHPKLPKPRPFHVKVLVSLGVVASAALAVFAPELQGHAMAIGVATNLVWVWGC
jgi:hypothetical protein